MPELLLLLLAAVGKNSQRLHFHFLGWKDLFVVATAVAAALVAAALAVAVAVAADC